MNQVLQDIPALRTAVGGVVSVSPTCGMTPSDVDAYVRAIERKARFASLHLRVLEGVPWDQVDGLERAARGPEATARLVVKLDEAQLEFNHPGAVIDHVYLAFDGLTSAVVNMTDTLARLVNAAYSVGIPERQASMIALKAKCRPTSALGSVLIDPRHTEWLRAVRELRGRCQHADIEDVLVLEAGPYARRGEPVVDRHYCRDAPNADIPIVSYARDAMMAAEATLSAAIAVIASHPTDPLGTHH